MANIYYPEGTKEKQNKRIDRLKASMSDKDWINTIMRDRITRDQWAMQRAFGGWKEGDAYPEEAYDIGSRYALPWKNPPVGDEYHIPQYEEGEYIPPYDWSKIKMEDPSWAQGLEAITGTAKDIGGDVRNLYTDMARFTSEFIPGLNYFLPDLLEESLYEGPEYYEYNGGKRPVEESFLPNLIKGSHVAETNPFKNLATRARYGVDAAAMLAPMFFTRGKLKPPGIPQLVDKLPGPMQKVAGQLLPFLSGRGSLTPFSWKGGPWWKPEVNLTKPSTLRNIALSYATKKDYAENPFMGSVHAAGIDSLPIGWGMHQQRGPGPWNQMGAKRLRPVKNIEIELEGQNIDRWPDHPGR